MPSKNSSFLNRLTFSLRSSTKRRAAFNEKNRLNRSYFNKTRRSQFERLEDRAFLSATGVEYAELFATEYSETEYSVTPMIVEEEPILVSETQFCESESPPAAPSDVSFDVYDATTQTVAVYWTDNSDNENGFYVESSSDGQTWILIGTTDQNQAEYVCENVDLSQNQIFRIAAFNDYGRSEWREASFRPAVPAAPSALTLGDYDAASQTVTASWIDNSDNEVGFRIEYSDDFGTTWAFVGFVEADQTSVVCENVSAESSYVFRVQAVNDEALSEWVYESYVVQVPATPSDVSFGVYDATTRTVAVYWTDNSDNETGFRIERSVDDGLTWNFAGTVEQDQTSFVCQDVAVVCPQIYRVAALNDSGRSNWTEASFAPAVPTTPSELTFDDYDAASQTVTVSWIDNSDNEVGFNIERSEVDGEIWTRVGVVGADQTSFVCENVSTNVPYVFRIQAFNEEALSEWTEATFSVQKPEAPSDIVFGSYDAATRTLAMSWTDNSDVEAGFVVEYSTNGGFDWTLAETLPSNTTSRICTDLAVRREYLYRVAAFNSGGYSDWTSASVMIANPQAPSDLVVKDYDPTTQSATVSWVDNSDDETGFRLLYSKDDGKTWTIAALLGANQTSAVFKGITNESAYLFRVAAYNSIGESDWAETTFAVPAPKAPSNIVFGTYDPTTKTVSMSWDDHADNETGFRVEYSKDGGKTWTLASILGADATSRVCKGVYASYVYDFRVAAFNGGGYSDWTEATFSVAKPAAPSDVVFDRYDAASQTLVMSWKDVADNETGYRVEYSKDGGKTWRLAQQLPANATSRTCTAVYPHNGYMFRVYAYNESGYSDSATGFFSATSPIAPSALVFSNYDETAQTVVASWTDNSENELGFKVEYSKDEGKTWVLAETTEMNVASHVCTRLEAGQTYLFRVIAFNSVGESQAATASFVAAVPKAPSGLVFGDYNPETKTVVASWFDNSNVEDGFKIEYSIDGGTTWTLAEEMGANATSRVCKGVSPNKPYTYRVAAFNCVGQSDWTVASLTAHAPTAPSNIMFGDYDSTGKKVAMYWNDNSNNENGFRVEYSKDGGETWNLSQVTGANVASRICTGVYPDKDYTFRVAAFNAAGYSDWVVASLHNEAPKAPSEVAFGVYDAKTLSVSMSWRDNSTNETGFTVEYSKDGGKTWYLAAKVGKDVVSRTCRSVYAGQTYDFRVAAYNGVGRSDWTYGQFTAPKDKPRDQPEPQGIEIAQASYVDEIFADLENVDEFF